MKLNFKYILIVIAVAVISVYGQAGNDSESWVDYAQSEYNIYPNITYSRANNTDLKLDLYMPVEHTKPVPVLMLFHGGGWVAGAKERNIMQLLPYLSMGWAVINVEYRLAGNSPAPAAVEDCRCALRWIYDFAGMYNFDIKKIVLTGGSAGGHLALITGMLPANSIFDRQCPAVDSLRWSTNISPDVKVAAIINWYGITDVAELINGPNAKNYAIEWFGSMNNREELAKLLSPINYVRADQPPVLTFHGENDNIVPFTQAKRLHAALDAAGVKNKLVAVPGAMHGGFKKAVLLNAFKEIRLFLRDLKILE
jgi:acetyl esterase/lipase